jgi:predicted ATPase/signal transduction histidine kinase
MTAPSPMPPFPVIPPYRITDLVHASDRTLVYRGRREPDQQPVVLKLLRQQPPSLDDDLRLRNHYSLTCGLDLPGINPPLTLESHGQRLVLVSRDDGSLSLADFLRQTPPHRLAWRDFLPIAIQLSQILVGLHQHRIIHKDIKPANILIQPETRRVTLIDFGLASQLPQETQTLQTPGLLEGTLAYLSPEQTGRMNRGIDYRSDFYALGVTFYELLTGQLPFQSNDPLELVYFHLAQEPVPPHQLAAANQPNPQASQPSPTAEPAWEIPVVLSQIVLKLMAKNAENRYQSALGLKADLERCLEQANTGPIADFALGQIDQLSQFNIPQKLYGRETQITTLLEAFERVSQGNCELVLLSGYSGVGKTALVNEILRQLTRQRGLFSSGKFDQFQRNVPLGAIMQAHRELIRQMLTESEANLQDWRDRFLQYLGANAQLIINAIPELELILGPQPPVPELGALESANRLIRTFNQFVAAFQRADHPRVIFMDDIQWADLTSLQSLQSFVTAAKNRYFLTIAAYRDNEVGPTHALMQTVEAIRQSGVPVTEINLTPLEPEHLTQLVSETLHQEARSVAPLANLLFEKTAGNPFFLTQLLKALHEDELLWFEPASQSNQNSRWKWSLSQIREREITDNVVELMVGKIIKLSEPTQRLLQLAACIGGRFQLQTLAAVSEQSISQTAEGLWEAIQTGLVLPVGEGYRLAQLLSAEEIADLAQGQSITYRFLHDRMQQAAYTLIPEAERQTTHLKVGRLLLENSMGKQLDEQIYEIVNHWNQAIELIRNQPAEQLKLAHLNLTAGRRARSTGAYEAALQYLKTGIALLPLTKWQTHYDLTLTLHVETAEAAFLRADFDRAQHLIEQILESASNVLDQVKAYDIQIQCNTAQNKLSEALQVGQLALQLLGVTLSNAESSDLLQQELKKVADLYAENSIASLVDLPRMVAPERIAAMQILAKLWAPAAMTNASLTLLITLKQVELSLQFGHASESTFAYALYASVLISMNDDIETGYEFGQLALNLLESLDFQKNRARTEVIVNNLVIPWKQEIQITLNPLLNAYHTGLETGDLEFASYAAIIYCYHSYFVGKELHLVEQDMRLYTEKLKQINQLSALLQHRLNHQAVLNLLGCSEDSTRLIGEVCDETELLQIESTNRMDVCVWHINRLILNYLFEMRFDAISEANAALADLDVIAGFTCVPLFYFYDSLARLRVLPEVAASEQELILEKVSTNQAKMGLWAIHSPGNYQHKYNLVEAEKYRVLGDFAQAIDFYDRAILAAHATSYIQEVALANELAAKFYLDWGKPKVAAAYMQEAYDCYRRWGAQAKLSHLETRYPQLLTPLLAPSSPSDPLLNLELGPADAQSSLQVSSPTSTVTDTTTLLDLTTILKASQAISQEIQLERLLKTLMQIAIENTGAQTGTLLLKSGEQWQVVAYCPEATACELQSSALTTITDQDLRLPLTVINYVQRTQTAVLVGEPDSPDLFGADPYWSNYAPQSILCLPILNQNKLIGILYLENYLTAGAFTHDRQEIVQLIAAQAAISLENAQLYSTLEQKVAERTQELFQTLQDLQATQQELIQAEKMAALGQLTASVAHEINTPLGVIRGATSNIAAAFKATLQQLPRLMQRLSPQQQTEFLNLIDAALHSQQLLSTREERQLRRQLKANLETQGIANAESIASQFILLGIGIDLSPYKALLQDADCLVIFEVAYNLVLQYQNTWSIQHEVDRAAKIVFALKTYTHQTYAAEKALANVIDGIEVVLTLYQHRLKQGVEVIRRYTEVPKILCNPDELIQVWVNLIDNAIYAMHQQGTLEIAVCQQSEQILIQITDSGAGISTDLQARIFEPFFTTKPQGEGSGLGLDIVRQIIQSHSGQIQVQSQPGRTTFQVQLPLSSQYN